VKPLFSLSLPGVSSPDPGVSWKPSSYHKGDGSAMRYVALGAPREVMDQSVFEVHVRQFVVGCWQKCDLL
jgi:hypothetical protein